ncbi:fumarylacetoacetate hydrolase family protein [Haloarchaeobius litoreus]|uniref:Fumarylacetoacetate hydrolase family protein n=1 Tax=Haloarchaeobius litoreus TaxID=755306 RepID=A0ABD6DKH5_9EURY|nr:fumarylacetoacetate hydrolase family protein [Haloarchaeobius litoreus]
MRYYQLRRRGESTLAAVTESGAYDLSSVKPDLASFADLVSTAEIIDRPPDEIVTPLLDDATELSMEAVQANCTLPVDVDEVWAAGVTYQISEEARKEESNMAQMYIDVYDAERPELFFKAQGDRTVGPDDAIGVRADSNWNVPEPELGIVLYRGQPVGYTVGNDVSSREIEGENPLYLPQAKIYERCCSLGPCVSTDIADPHALEMSMTITRDEEPVYQETTNTAEMVRTCEELVSYYTRHNVLPEVAVLLTGTSLVPEEGFTLQAGDHVDIEVEDIGVLSNPVVSV